VNSFKLKAAVAFLVFNRPDTTRRVFEEIRRARPPKLLVVADGPRADRPGEVNKCQAVRAIIDTVDWPCEVLKNYSDVNLGCKVRLTSGLDWVFDQTEEAIILEDDCLPEPSFFEFCELMLERYRSSNQIMLIAGTNFLLEKNDVIDSYYFSNLVSIWGWATWGRAWKLRSLEFTSIDESVIKTRFNNKRFSSNFCNVLRNTLTGKVDTWDVQWCYTVIVNNGLCVTPIRNQIKNIGFIGTHTDIMTSPFHNMATQPINLTYLKHPTSINVNYRLDQIAIDNLVVLSKLPGNFFEKLFFAVTKRLRLLLRFLVLFILINSK